MNATTSRRLAAVAVILALPALSSCGVNFKAQTDQVYQPAEGVNDRDGEVDVLNAIVVSGESGTGRFIAGLTNETDEDETLTAVTGVGVDQSIDIALEDGDFTVPAGGLLQLADADAGMVVLVGDQVVAGYFVRLQLQFSDADPVEVNVPVVAPGEDYQDVELPDAADVAADDDSDSSGG